MEMNEQMMAMFQKMMNQMPPEMLQQMMGAANEGKENSTRKFTDKEKVRPVSLGEAGGSYIERTNLLFMMEDKLLGNPSDKHVLILSGHGGEGKSELARAYAYNHKDEYEEIFFVPVSEDMNEKGKVGSLLDLISKAGYKVDDIGILDGKSEDKNSLFDLLPDNTLFIIDNYNTEDIYFMDEVLNRTGSVDFIFTSRLHNHRKVSKDQFLYIDELNDDKTFFCKELFIKNYELPNEEGEVRKVQIEELQDITTICASTANNPMLVVLSAAELREYKNRSIHDFAEKIKDGITSSHLNGAEVNVTRNEGEELSGELPEIVSSIFSDLFTYDFSEAEKEVLSVLRLSPSASVDETFLCKILGDDNDNIRMREAIKKMNKRNWIQKNDSGVSMHPLVEKLLQSARLNKNVQLLTSHEFYLHLVKNWICMPYEIQESDRYYISLLYNAFCPEKEIGTLDETEQILFLPYYVYKVRVCRLPLYVVDENETEYYYDDYGFNTDLDNPFRYYYDQYFNAKEKFFNLFTSLFPDIKEGYLVKREYTYGTQYWVYYLKNENATKLSKRCLFGSVNYHDLGAYYEKEINDVLKNSDSKEENSILIHVVSQDKVSTQLFGYLKELDIKEIAGRVFYYNDYLGTELHLPERLRKIGFSAFANCTHLFGSLFIPDSVEEVESMAFRSCNGFTGTLHLPLEGRQIGSAAFQRCYGFTGDLKIPPKIERIEENTFSWCSGFSGRLSLPEGLKIISEYAFCDCGRLTGELVLPESLIKIGESAFSGCYGFVGDLNIPSNVEEIENCVFLGCSGFSGRLSLPEGIKEIREGAFSDCAGFTGRLILPEGLKIIDDFAFQECSGFSGELEFPEGLEYIGECAFADCIGLTGNIHFPEDADVGEDVFSGCENVNVD